LTGILLSSQHSFIIWEIQFFAFISCEWSQIEGRAQVGGLTLVFFQSIPSFRTPVPWSDFAISNVFLVNGQDSENTIFIVGFSSTLLKQVKVKVEELTFQTSQKRKISDQRLGNSASSWKYDTHTHTHTTNGHTLRLLYRAHP